MIVNSPLISLGGVKYMKKAIIGKKIGMTQIFNENGKGVILRGTPVIEDKDDKKPHLTYQQSLGLLNDALNKYKFATGTMPGRVVLHKTSKSNK